jgi:hypothetical protein
MSRSCWRNEEDYLYLSDADRAGIAWEFLRRNADYRALASAQSAPLPERRGTIELLAVEHSALKWGLLFRGVTDSSGG